MLMVVAAFAVFLMLVVVAAFTAVLVLMLFLVLGHLGSERDGMRLVADILKEKLPEIPTEYIESGEVYTYTD